MLVAGLFLLLAAGAFCLPGIDGGLKRTIPSWMEPLDARKVEYQQVSYDVVKVDPSKVQLRLYWKDQYGNPFRDFDKLKKHLARQGKYLRFATNAGIFSEDHTPGGLHIEDGHVLHQLNLRDGGGNFHMKPNGVFVLGSQGASVMASDEYSQSAEAPPQIATQSGPMLVIDDKLHPAFQPGSDNRFIRNGIGVDATGHIWIAISNSPVNFYDFATFFRDKLGCPDALYLDGSISQFFLPELDRFDKGSDLCGILAIVE